MLVAKDVMSKEPMTIREETKVKEVIRLLVERKVTGLPVVSEDMRLLGIVTEKDVLKMLYGRNTKVKTAADLMTRRIEYFDENDSLLEVFKCLVENSFRRVPVLSQGKLVGIISRADIIRFLSEKTAKREQMESED
jgi:CBS domain-containing protein